MLPGVTLDGTHGTTVIRLSTTQAKAKILSLLDDVAGGQEVEVAKHGRTVSRLVPAVGSHALKGSLAGVAMTAGPEEDLFTTRAACDLG